MNRKTLIAFGAFAVLSLIAFLKLREPDKGERQGDQPARPVARLKSTDFDTLEVTKAKATTVLKRDGAKFKVVSPTAYAADDSVAKLAFEAMEKLEFSSIVTEQKAKHAEFEVADDSALRVTAKSGNNVVADLLIGKPMGGGTMVRPVGKDEVWQANGSIKFNFDKNPADWRDKSITTFIGGEAETIDVKSKTGGTIALKKTDKKEGADDLWAVTASSLKIDKLDNTVPSGIVSALSVWKANDFADGAKSEQTGLADPALTITVGLKGGKKSTVLIGNKKADDEFYVQAGDKPQVFVIKKYNMDRVNKRPIEFRDKTICDITDADLTDLSVTHGAESYALAKSGKDWKATKPAKTEIDPAKVTSIVGAFKGWKATGFAEETDPKALGLVKPQAVIVAKSKATTCTLKVGDETKDKQSYFVQAGASPDVYLVAKWATDRALVKVADIKKTTVAGK
jgi:hypothetical protein